jgi:hypothetical protein
MISFGPHFAPMRVPLLQLDGEEARTDVSQSQQIVRQLRTELEDVLRILRR